MKKEEKELLLKDLCARLPYGVKLNFYSKATNENVICTLLGIEPDGDKPIIAKTTEGCFCFTQDHIKPYLRPMSSMTDYEKKSYRSLQEKIAVQWDKLGKPIGYVYAQTVSSIDWLLEHHFDFRRLIDKGLALEAPEEMYNN